MNDAPALSQAEIDAKIDAFGAALSEQLKDDLSAVLVYGSLAKKDYVPASSDHNVALVLQDDHAQALRKVAQVMRDHRPSRKTTLLLLTREELARARDVFPLKLRDLARHHRLVSGTNSGLGAREVPKADVARDCEQQLRSLAIRSRRLFLRGTSNPEALRHNLTISYRGMLPPLAGLAELITGEEVVTHEQILQGAAKALEIDAGPLLELRRWHREPSYAPAESQFNVVLDALVDVLRLGAAKADALHEAYGPSPEFASADDASSDDTPALSSSSSGDDSSDEVSEAVPTFGASKDA